MATKISFARGLASALGIVEDGRISYATDTKKLYMDSNVSRNMLNSNADWNATSGNSKIDNKPFNVVKSTDSGDTIYDITFN